MIDLNDYFNPVSIESPEFEHLSMHRQVFLTIFQFIPKAIL